jgi:ferredoxin, 2Fe-2S
VSSLKVTYVQTDGVERTIEDAKPGWSLMEVARANDIEGILGDCGGACACATCHVYIDPEWQEAVGAPDDVEAEMLDMVSDVRRTNSRLACQIKLSAELDGLRVTVAPAS